MSSDHSDMSRLEATVLMLAVGALLIWYAYPQLFFSLYPVYEIARLLLPGRLPPLPGS